MFILPPQRAHTLTSPDPAREGQAHESLLGYALGP
jgi:hypothetical protein